MFCQAGFDQWLTTIMQHLLPSEQAAGHGAWRCGASGWCWPARVP